MRFLIALTFMCYTTARIHKTPLFDLEKSAGIYANYLSYFNKSYDDIELLRHYELFKLELKRLNKKDEESGEVFKLDEYLYSDDPVLLRPGAIGVYRYKTRAI